MTFRENILQCKHYDGKHFHRIIGIEIHYSSIQNDIYNTGTYCYPACKDLRGMGISFCTHTITVFRIRWNRIIWIFPISLVITMTLDYVLNSFCETTSFGQHCAFPLKSRIYPFPFVHSLILTVSVHFEILVIAVGKKDFTIYFFIYLLLYCNIKHNLVVNVNSTSAILRFKGVIWITIVHTSNLIRQLRIAMHH